MQKLLAIKDAKAWGIICMQKKIRPTSQYLRREDPGGSEALIGVRHIWLESHEHVASCWRVAARAQIARQTGKLYYWCAARAWALRYSQKIQIWFCLQRWHGEGNLCCASWRDDPPTVGVVAVVAGAVSQWASLGCEFAASWAARAGIGTLQQIQQPSAIYSLCQQSSTHTHKEIGTAPSPVFSKPHNIIIKKVRAWLFAMRVVASKSRWLWGARSYESRCSMYVCMPEWVRM